MTATIAQIRQAYDPSAGLDRAPAEGAAINHELTRDELVELATVLMESSDRLGEPWKEGQNRFIAWQEFRGAPQWMAYPKREPTLQDFIDHLEGRNHGIGTYLSNNAGTMKRLVFDIDKHDKRTQEDADYNLWHLCERLHKLGVPHLTETSKSGNGYHVELWFAEPVPTALARRFGHIVAWQAGLYTGTDPTEAKRTIEVYPKQDELHGRLGNQVARPGSRYWMERTGGSTYLRPGTRDPLPMSEWTAAIREAMIQDAEGPMRAYVEDFGPAYDSAHPTPHRASATSQPQKSGAAVGTPRPDCADPTLETFISGLEASGIRIEKVESYSDAVGYTTKITPERCPNWTSHSKQTPGPQGVGGAVFLWGPGRPFGFKCMHHHCTHMTWSDARKIFDPGKKSRFVPRRLRPARTQVEAKAKREQTPDGQLARVIKRHLRLWGDKNRTHADEDVGRMGRRAFRVATCGDVHWGAACNCHGAQAQGARPCDDSKMCLYCVTRTAQINAAWIRREWPKLGSGKDGDRAGGHKEVVHVFWECPAGDRDVLYHERKRIVKAWDKYSHAKPRFRTAWNGIHFFFTHDNLVTVQKRWKEVTGDQHPGYEVITAERAADVYQQAVLSIVHGLHGMFAEAAVIAERNPVEGRQHFSAEAMKLAKSPWFTNGAWAFAGGGRDTCRELPIQSLDDYREEVADRLLKERDGVPLGQCCQPVLCSDGLMRPCGRHMGKTYWFGPTGMKLSECPDGDQEGKAATRAITHIHITDFYRRMPTTVVALE